MALEQDHSKVATAPAVRSPGGAAAVVDRDALLAMVENDFVLLRELVELFMAETPGLIAELRAGLRENNAERVERSAHTLKGAVGNFAGRRAFEAARAVELSGHDGQLDKAAALVPALEDEFSRVCLALSEILREAEK
jgi:HPt (histidine-containing phosphotransfer) domain-containing protein